MNRLLFFSGCSLLFAGCANCDDEAEATGEERFHAADTTAVVQP
ncbi:MULTISPECIES: hypothetical protein [unclassified Flavobacterium]|nr:MULTISPECIES: hypothetical protein [unclassified Flavobacterium]